MPTPEEDFAVTVLKAPLGMRTEYGRRTAPVRICTFCDELVFKNDPLAVRSATNATGHDPDCRGLEIFTSGFGGNGGGSSSAVTLARTDITLGTAGVTLGTTEF